MANWSNYKVFICLLFPILFAFVAKENKGNRQWGFYGHKHINRIAVFTLPPPLFGFYKEHIDYLTDHAVDPDKRRYILDDEAPCHFIDIDRYKVLGEDVFTTVPQIWNDAVAKYTEDTLRAHGIVPWHIISVKFKLQKAFENRNVDLILKYSADLGHYVADAHVPLHTTENYNGQLTGQKGIHGLWESRLVELNAQQYDYFVGKSEYLDPLLAFAWKTIKESHQAVDSVLRIEKEITLEFEPSQKYSFESRGTNTVKVYSQAFCNEYHARLNGMVERRMRAAIISVGSIWYTAWVDAGQPDLDALRHISPSKNLKNEWEALQKQLLLNGSVKGRICE